jgi:hypothetical protein
MLLWLHAPSLALAVLVRQREQPELRSSAAQRELLHIELGELQQALMKAWRLPELLVRISDGRDETEVFHTQSLARLAHRSRPRASGPRRHTRGRASRKTRPPSAFRSAVAASS